MIFVECLWSFAHLRHIFTLCKHLEILSIFENVHIFLKLLVFLLPDVGKVHSCLSLRVHGYYVRSVSHHQFVNAFLNHPWGRDLF